MYIIDLVKRGELTLVDESVVQMTTVTIITVGVESSHFAVWSVSVCFKKKIMCMCGHGQKDNTNKLWK